MSKPLCHSAALDAIGGCAKTVTVLSYEEAIEAYLRLRGFPSISELNLLSFPLSAASQEPSASLEKDDGDRAIALEGAIKREMDKHLHIYRHTGHVPGPYIEGKKEAATAIARLLLPAPALLAELKNCVWLLADLQPEPGLVQQQARAAIAKTEITPRKENT